MELAPTTIAIAVIVLLVVAALGAALGIGYYRRQRTKQLQDRFGPEYDRTIKKVGDQRQAESELENRVGRVRALDVRPLSPQEIERFSADWKLTQAEFVDQPLSAVRKANRLIKEAMAAKGYPVDDFEQRAADISVSYPDLVENYRGLHTLAVKGDQDHLTTEELRRAMIHGRALFEQLVQQTERVTDISEKERT